MVVPTYCNANVVIMGTSYPLHLSARVLYFDGIKRTMKAD